MDVTLYPSAIGGEVNVTASKSVTQRAYVLALLHPHHSIIRNAGNSEDENAMLEAIKVLGAEVNALNGDVIQITGVHSIKGDVKIDCGESGLAIRILTMIAALADKEITITGCGSALRRDFKFFQKFLPSLGVKVNLDGNSVPITVCGPLQIQDVEVDGSLSSQYMTGVLLAFGKKVQDKISISILDPVSTPYIDLTVQMMKHFGYEIYKSQHVYHLSPNTNINKEIVLDIEADWSNGSFWLVAAAIAGEATIKGLNPDSLQGDKKILHVLAYCGINLDVQEKRIQVFKPHFLYAFMFNATDTPDLFPPLVALACYCNGLSIIKGVHRLKNKESDRAKTLVDTFTALGAQIYIEGDELFIQGSTLKGGTVQSNGDHRIVMAVAIAALRAENPVTITGAEAVNKSYPDFFSHLKKLGASFTIHEKEKR